MSTRNALVATAILAAGVAGSFAFAEGRDANSKSAVVARAATAPAPLGAVHALPAPDGPGILTLLGVEKGNSGATTTKLDYATVDALAHERLVVDEPFVHRKVSFTGVRLGEFMRAAGFPRATTRLAMHAVDDYHVDLPVSGLTKHAYLATRSGGKPIPIANGGPVRLVFRGTDGLAKNSDNWIWSIDRIKAG
jgi:hypothetical protein